MGKFMDLTGQTFGRLTVVEFSHKGKHGHSCWKCQCSCGNIIVVQYGNIKKGTTKSCGCLKKEFLTKHGMAKTRFYKSWKSMKIRCLNKNREYYKYYGGRGITVCEEWLDFNNFKNDMYESYLGHVKDFGEKQTTLDRIDNNGNYCKENCKWSTYKEQIANQRDKFTQKWFRAISPSGEEFVLNNQREFARENGLNQRHISSCLNRKSKHHKQWKFQYLTEEEIEQYNLHQSTGDTK